MKVLVLVVVFTILSSVSADSGTCTPVGLMMECSITLDVIPDEPVKVSWHRTDGTGKSVSQEFEINSTYSIIQLFRFAPLTEYTIQISPFGSSVITSQVTSGSSGFDEIDTRPLAIITGTPTYGILFLDIGNGYAVIDETGWVVWFYNTNGTLPMEPAQAKSQLPNFDFVFLKDGFIEQVKPNLTVVAYVTYV